MVHLLKLLLLQGRLIILKYQKREYFLGSSTWIKKKKANGLGRILNLFLISYGEWCSKYLAINFKRSLEMGIIPRIIPMEWKLAKVIFTSNLGEISSYGPISLLDTAYKILEPFFYRHISSFLEWLDFFLRISTIFVGDSIRLPSFLKPVISFARAINFWGQVDVVFLNFAKAFDWVSHTILLLKIQNILNNRKLKPWSKSYGGNNTLTLIGTNLSWPLLNLECRMVWSLAPCFSWFILII